jgi:hypothetical protein
MISSIHTVRLAKLVLPRIHVRPLRGDAVPLLTNIQAFPSPGALAPDLA